MTQHKMLSTCLLSLTLLSFQAHGMMKRAVHTGMRFLQTSGAPGLAAVHCQTRCNFSTSNILHTCDSDDMDSTLIEQQKVACNLSKQIFEKILWAEGRMQLLGPLSKNIEKVSDKEGLMQNVEEKLLNGMMLTIAMGTHCKFEKFLASLRKNPEIEILQNMDKVELKKLIEKTIEKHEMKNHSRDIFLAFETILEEEGDFFFDEKDCEL